MIPFKELEPLDFEINRYEKIIYSGSSNYIPIEEDKPTWTGQEHESVSKWAPWGDPDTFEMKEELWVINMPEALIKPLDFPGSQLICPHQTIRSFIPFTKFSETDIEYYLFPEERRVLYHKDDISIWNDQTIDLNTWFLTTNNINVTTQELPGNIGIRTVDYLPI